MGTVDEIAGMRIGEVARRTGTTTALLRAWETRHDVLVPARTAGGQRLYSERDVARVRLVQRLLAEGWSIDGAVARLRESGDLPSAPHGQVPDDERPRPDDGAAERSRLDLIAPLGDVDSAAVRVAFDTARAMLRASSPAELRDALVALVEQLGGTTGPATTQDDDVIPVDLSFAAGSPVLPRAAAASVARMRLEALLHALVEDARALAHQLQLSDRSVSRRA